MTRRKFLDASLIPLERALLARADVYDRRAADQRIHELPWAVLAQEFRALAEELHEDGRP